MPLLVFLLLSIVIMWGIFALGYEAGQRWPIVGRVLEEYYGGYLVVIVVCVILAILLGVIGIEIR